MRDYRKFFTPDYIADKMVDLAEIDNDSLILEPHAGNGQIVRAIRRLPHHASWQAMVHSVEIDMTFGPILSTLSNHVIIEDFITTRLEKGFYNRIIANPPFGKGVNLILHLNKMIGLLATKGILVSIIPKTIKIHFISRPEYCTFYDINNWSQNSDGSTTPICIVKYIKL